MRSVMIGLVAVAVLLGGCSDKDCRGTGPVFLELPGQSITDEVLAEKVKGLTNLKDLRLSRTQVTDAGLVHLKGLTKLEWLHLDGTKVTDAGVQKLQKALPGCKIIH